jgi:hypothetical protein
MMGSREGAVRGRGNTPSSVAPLPALRRTASSTPSPALGWRWSPNKQAKWRPQARSLRQGGGASSAKRTTAPNAATPFAN